MKKLLSALLIICSLLTLFGCNNSKNDGIALTVDNFEDYFDIDAGISRGVTALCEYKGKLVYLYKTFKCDVTFTGNPNYEFNDVTVGIKFVHTGPDMLDYYTEQVVYVDLNFAGKGSGECHLETPVASAGENNISSMVYAFYSENNISLTLDYSGYEIVSVTGTATKN